MRENNKDSDARGVGGKNMAAINTNISMKKKVRICSINFFIKTESK